MTKVRKRGARGPGAPARARGRRGGAGRGAPAADSLAVCALVPAAGQQRGRAQAGARGGQPRGQGGLLAGWASSWGCHRQGFQDPGSPGVIGPGIAQPDRSPGSTTRVEGCPGPHPARSPWCCQGVSPTGQGLPASQSWSLTRGSPCPCSFTRSSGSEWSWWAWTSGTTRTRSTSAPRPAPRWTTSWPGGNSTCWGGTPTTTPSSSRECASARGAGPGAAAVPGRTHTLVLFPAGSTSLETPWDWPRCPPCAPRTRRL